MGWAIFMTVLLAACGSSREAVICEYSGTTYRVGESFPLDCNICQCTEDGMLACTGAACFDAGDGLDAGDGVDAGSSADAGLTCSTTQRSTLPGASIAFPDQPCVFTLAQAAEGIGIDYDIVIESATMSVTARPQDAGCGTPGPSGLIGFERLTGDGQSYCLCDTGLCAGGEAPTTMIVGDHRSTFMWLGRNWFGPSDTGNPMGEPFPPGSYTLEVSALGTVGGAEYRVEGEFEVHLVP